MDIKNSLRFRILLAVVSLAVTTIAIAVVWDVVSLHREVDAQVEHHIISATEQIAQDGTPRPSQGEEDEVDAWLDSLFVVELYQNMDRHINQLFLIMALLITLVGGALLVLLLVQRRHYKQMKKVAFTDRLTGGMNQAAFQLKCEAVLAGAAPGAYSIALLDVKNFKMVNELFGSVGANRMLREIMRALQAQVPGKGFAARANADNFFLCLEGGDPGRIAETVEELTTHVKQAVKLLDAGNPVPYQLILQPGVYIVDDPTVDITIIQDRARAACRNRTTSEDGVCKFYDVAIMDQLKEEQELNRLFEGSLANGDFQVYLQPKVWTQREKAGGAEALVRWQHPRRGRLSPADFIPLFERNRNICKLDLYVFEVVCRTVQRWKATGKTLVPISVNLSRQHFEYPNCLAAFSEIARRYQVPEGMIELELTESILFDEQRVEEVKGYIDEMHRLGVLCSLDDFGSGFSSLGLLTELDVDAIKLDRRFFKDVKNPKVREVISSIVALAHKIGAITVAEGIETPEQLQLLREVGCDMIQGYIYARPVPIPTLEGWLNPTEEGRQPAGTVASSSNP